jgi:hypothetical protein
MTCGPERNSVTHRQPLKWWLFDSGTAKQAIFMGF